MRDARRVLLAAAALSALVACGHGPRGPGGGAGAAATAAGYRLIGFANAVRAADAAARREAFEKAREAADRGDAEARVRLAILRSTPGTEHYAPARARELLDQVLAGAPDAGVAGVATLLRDRLRDQVSGERHACVDAAEHARTDADRLRRELASTRARCDELQAKLDELKRLEQRVNEMTMPEAASGR